MTLPAPPKIIQSLHVPVRPFHSQERKWVLRHQGDFSWMIGVSIFLVLLGLGYLHPDKRLLRHACLIVSCGFIANIAFKLAFGMRSLRLLAEGLNHRWFTQKTVCHAYFNQPIHNLEQVIKDHRFGIYFISLPFLRNALEHWLLQSPVIGTYELACLEDALLRYMSHHYPIKSHQNRLKVIKNLTPHSIDQLWLEFKTGLDQRMLQNATPMSASLHLSTARRL